MEVAKPPPPLSCSQRRNNALTAPLFPSFPLSRRGHVTRSWRGEVDSDGEEEGDDSFEAVDTGHVEMLWGTVTSTPPHCPPNCRRFSSDCSLPHRTATLPPSQDRSSVYTHKLVYSSSLYFKWINLCIVGVFLGAAKGYGTPEGEAKNEPYLNAILTLLRRKFRILQAVQPPFSPISTPFETRLGEGCLGGCDVRCSPSRRVWDRFVS